MSRLRDNESSWWHKEWLWHIVMIATVAAITLAFIFLHLRFPLGYHPGLYALLVLVTTVTLGIRPAFVVFVIGVFAVIPEGWHMQAEFLLDMAIVSLAITIVRVIRKHVNQLLEDGRQTSKQLTSILESISAAFFILDKDWRFTYVNHEMERLTQKSSGELKGMNIWSVFPMAVRSLSYQMYHEALDKQAPVVFQTQSPFSREWVEVRIYPSGEGLMIYEHNISERKKAEEALIQSEQKHRSLFETMAQGTIYYDSEGRIFSVNHAALEILGRSLEELMDKRIDELGLDVIRTDGSTIPMEEAPARIAFETGREVRNVVLGVYNPQDEDYRWLSVSAIPQFRSGELKPYQVYATFADTTELLKLRQAIERNYVLLQRGLFPPRPAFGEGYEVAARYVPAYEGQEIGGDFYDVFKTSKEGQLAVLIGDISGKGIEAAARAAATRSTIRALAFETARPGYSLTRANAVLYDQQSNTEAFATVFLAIIDLPDGYVRYATAGQPPPVVRRADGGAAEFLAIGYPPLGVVVAQEYGDFEDRIAIGDKIVLYTDGISEARRGKELFGEEGVRECVEKHGDLSCSDLANRILNSAEDWAGGHITDDIAIVVVECQPERKD